MKFLTFIVYIKNIKRSLSLLSVMLLLMTACRIGPAYKRPNVIDESWTWKNQTIKDSTNKNTADSTFNSMVYNQNDSLKLADKWWLIFGDDTLNQLIETAFNNNPGLKTSAFRIMEARGMINNARANYYPVITIDPSISRNQLSGNRPNQFSGTSLPQLTLTTISVPLDMSYELDVWGKFRNSVAAAEANMRATQADYEVMKLSLSSDIASNYFTLRLIDNQIQIYSNAFKLRNDNLNLTRSQYEAGLTTKLDVVQAEIEAATVEAQIIDSRRARAMSENAIAVLCGIPVMNLKINPQSGLPNVPAIPVEVPSELLMRRPDIAEAEQQLIYANAQIGVANAAFLPSVKLTGASAGFLSSKFDNLFEKQSTTWLAGVGISIPIFAGGRNIAQKTIAEARLRESESTYKQIVLNAFREVQDAMANIEYRAQQASVQQRALASARSSSDMSKELYRTGLTTYVNVIVADRAVLDAENAFIFTTGQRILYSISLIKALGGGWKK